MEYNYQGRILPHVPVCLDFKNGKLYPSGRLGLGVELDFKHLTWIAEITEPVTARANPLPARMVPLPHYQLVENSPK